MCEDMELLKIDVPLKYLGTEGVSLPREGRYFSGVLPRPPILLRNTDKTFHKDVGFVIGVGSPV